MVEECFAQYQGGHKSQCPSDESEDLDHFFDDSFSVFFKIFEKKMPLGRFAGLFPDLFSPYEELGPLGLSFNERTWRMKLFKFLEEKRIQQIFDFDVLNS